MCKKIIFHRHLLLNQNATPILFLIPKNLKEGQPSYERTNAFKSFYSNNEVKVFQKETPSTMEEKIKIINFIYKNKIKNIFITMPPFRNWFLFLLPNINIIIDIRDGWSIAMQGGYGGTVKPSPFKALIARYIEKMALFRSALTITCTPGLKDYLEDFSSKNILLITNGYSKSDYDIVEKLKNEKVKKDSVAEVAICVGQFSEYGERKIQLILSKINASAKKTIVKLIGSDLEKNRWIFDWIKKNNLLNIELQILPRMSREKMYKEILQSDYGIAVIRDPDYEFGTKVFDYILCKKPIFDYFNDENNFSRFFKTQMSSSEKKDFSSKFLREELIELNRNILLDALT